MRELTAVDLFAGGGGLSVGLVNAGFHVTHAIEKHPPAVATYALNHPGTDVIGDDIQTVSSSSLLTNGVAPDLIAGCPPCQGFTSLTSKYKKEDPRNGLIHEMKRLILELRPRAIMMENVPGLIGRGMPHLKETIEALQGAGYIVSYDVLQAVDYGVPQSRRRFVLLAGLGFSIPIPKVSANSSPSTLRQVIGDLPAKTLEFSDAKIPRGASLESWHVTRRLSSANRERLQATKAGGSRVDLPEHLKPACHQGGYSGFRNVYGRMEWDKPSPTITAGCTSFSKGRFGHPSADRTISVFEAGLLQGFPAHYRMGTDRIDQACSIIGNAFPVPLATLLAKHVHSFLKR